MAYPDLSIINLTSKAPTQLTRQGALNGSADLEPFILNSSQERYLKDSKATIARDLVQRTLTSGKSMQFIYTGAQQLSTTYPAKAILGNDQEAPPVAEKTITIDDLHISSAFVYELDETLAHYDLRGEISAKIGYALAEKYDRKIFRAVTKAARQASPITKTNFVEPGGTQIQQVGSTSPTGSDAYDSVKLVNAFYDAAAALDEKGVSSEGRVAVLTQDSTTNLYRT